MGFVTRYLALLVALLALPFQDARAGAHLTNSPARVTAAVAGPGQLTLSVYPNPARGQVSIQLNAPVGQDYKFRLSNVLGREMRLVALRPDLTGDAVTVDVSSLPAGMYFYSLLVNDHVVSTSRLTLQ